MEHSKAERTIIGTRRSLVSGFVVSVVFLLSTRININVTWMGCDKNNGSKNNNGDEFSSTNKVHFHTNKQHSSPPNGIFASLYASAAIAGAAIAGADGDRESPHNTDAGYDASITGATDSEKKTAAAAFEIKTVPGIDPTDFQTILFSSTKEDRDDPDAAIPSVLRTESMGCSARRRQNRKQRQQRDDGVAQERVVNNAGKKRTSSFRELRKAFLQTRDEELELY